ncbi:MAG: queuosine precursor transporter [Chlamydiia bacterium]|nr:queuosine precursor transporter [Chlamydiia bacterium]
MTLAIASGAGILGKRYGPEFPIGIMAAMVVIAAILANKLVAIGPFAAPGGIVVISSTFLITDILSEKWGREVAQRAVWVGFYSLLALVITLFIATRWEAPFFAKEQADAFASVLGLTPRITLASIIAYLFSQNHDVWAFHFWKNVSGGKHLWLRNNASTIVSQAIDTVIFITIAFYGIFPIVPLIIDMIILKTVIALLDTPFIYIVSWVVDRSPMKENLSFIKSN